MIEKMTNRELIELVLFLVFWGKIVLIALLTYIIYRINHINKSQNLIARGFDRAGESDDMAISELRQFCIDNNRTLLLRTPTMTVPTSTYVEGRFQIEANTTGGALAGSVELLNEQLVVI